MIDKRQDEIRSRLQKLEALHKAAKGMARTKYSREGTKDTGAGH